MKALVLAVGTAAIALTIGLRRPMESPPSPTVAETRGLTVDSISAAESAAPALHPPAQLAPADVSKYRYLFDELSDPALAQHVASLFAEREAATDTNRQHAIDKQLAEFLSPNQQALFVMLRESDVEQAQLSDFAGGIGGVAALDEHQRRELLLTKLRHKQNFELWERQSGLDLELPSPADRSYAHQTIGRALLDYRDAYLSEMRAHLTDEQFRALSDFEHTEFAIRLERYQQAINAR